jgi:hypothetical protein
MRYIRQLGIVVTVLCGACIWAGPAEAAYGSAQSPALSTTPPFTQCPAVYEDASCTDLIVITNSAPQGVILRDPEVGFYEGSDDVLVGVQNESSAPVSSLKLGVPGSGDDTFGFDGDGLCNPGGPPVPTECPFAPSTTEELLGSGLSNGWGYWGPDAQLTPESSDAGTVTFPEPLQPGQYTYFSLESQPGNATINVGTDLIETSLSDGGSETGQHITDPNPVDVTDTAFLVGEHKAEVPVGKKVIYRLYSDPSCTKEITAGGKAAGGEVKVETEGVLPASTPFGSTLATNAVYYWRAEYEGDNKGNSPVVEPCGDETMTFGTPPARSTATVTTTLKAGAESGTTLTVAPGTAVTDTASATLGGAPQGGRVTYYVYQDAGCTQQVAGARLGSAASTSGAYGPSSPVALPLGTYYFQAIYSGSGSVAPARSVCGSEVLNVEPPCACASVKAYLNKFSVFGKDSTRLGMRLNIALTCTGGPGKGCASEVVIHAPAGAKFIDSAKGAKPTEVVTIHCGGPCSKTTIQRVSLTWLALKTTKKKKGKKTITTTRPIKSFLPQGRAKKSKVITIEMLCDTSGGVVKTIAKMTVHFDKHGQVDYKLSDLNGDGKPDRKQLNEF